MAKGKPHMALDLSEKVIRQPRKVEDKSDVILKLKQSERALEIARKEIGILNIYCRDSQHWKSIIVCGLICTGCNEFLSYRWLCIYNGECGNLKRCKQKNLWCKPVGPKRKIVKDYLRLYKQWRKMKKSLKTD